MIASSAGSLGVVRHLVQIGADRSASTSGAVEGSKKRAASGGRCRITALSLARDGAFGGDRKRQLLKELMREEEVDDLSLTYHHQAVVDSIEFCEACDTCYAESPGAHAQSVSHLLRQNGVDSICDGASTSSTRRKDLSVFGIAGDNRGFRLMVDKMGWDANSGLGKTGDGRRSVGRFCAGKEIGA